MKRIDLDAKLNLFDSRGRPSAGGADHCGCIVSALYLREFPEVTKDGLVEVILNWLDKPDHDRNRLTHPCVVALTEEGYALPYLDGLLVGFDGLSLLCRSRTWLAQGEESSEALEFVAGVVDGRQARRLFKPSL